MARINTRPSQAAMLASASAAAARAAPQAQAAKNVVAQARNEQSLHNVPLLRGAFNDTAAAFPKAGLSG